MSQKSNFKADCSLSVLIGFDYILYPAVRLKMADNSQNKFGTWCEVSEKDKNNKSNKTRKANQ